MSRRERTGREGLAALLPLVEDGKEALEAVLHGLASDAASPFASVESTHFARLVLVRDPDCLFFAAEFDIPVRGYVEALCVCMPDEADRIFAPCVGYPRANRPPALERWLLDHRLRAGFSLHGNPGATVSEVRRSLVLRERIMAFAVQARGLEPEAFARRWRAERWDEPAAGPAPPGPSRPRLRRQDIQGNILRGYGRRFGHGLLLFLRVEDPARARRWAAELPGRVTTEAPWRQAPRFTVNVAFTHRGLRALGLPAEVLGRFPDAFRQGMEARAPALGDTHASDPEEWEPGLKAAGVLLTVTAHDPFTRDQVAAQLQAEAVAGGLSVAHAQRTRYIDGGREPFGFRDGLSEPVVRGLHSDRRYGPGSVLPGEFLLGHRDEGGSIPPHPGPIGFNGSYMVVRKLDQDVEAFWRAIREEAGADRARQEWLAARIVGRWRDGTPVVLAPDLPRRPGSAGPAPANEFGFAADPDGVRCPIGAHIRRVNPRDSVDARGRLSRRHLIIRRGMPYPPSEDGGSAGLMFVCFQASIERQFEFVQSQWCNDGNAFGLGDDPDPLVGPGEGKLIIQGSPPAFLPVRRFVTTRGGDYFFAPGIAALERIAGR